MLAACASVDTDRPVVTADLSVEQDVPEDDEPSASDDDAGDDDADESQRASDTDAEAPDDAPGTVTTSDPSGDLVVHFLDVGQGDATLLVHDEVAVLVDAGRHQGRAVIDHLDRLGVDHLDLVVVTHPHADHIGQFDAVLATRTVDEVWWSGATTTTQVFGRALDALEASDAAYEEPRAPATTRLGPLIVDVLNPGPGASMRDVHDSGLGLRITYGTTSLVVTGDAEHAAEARMVREVGHLLPAQLLQLGHHGSRTSTIPAFLSAVSPDVAVYSAGSGNAYGHPSGEVLDRLAAAGIATYGTDVHGTVTATTDGSRWRMATSRNGTPRAGASARSGGSSPSGPTAPAPAPAPSPSTAPSGEGCTAGQVDVNTADHGALQRIVHLGPVRADEALRIRPFASVDDLRRISGIADARLADIRAQGLACAS